MKLLITGALKRNDAFFAKLSSEGYGITYITDERIPLEDQDVDPAYFEGVICNSLFLYTPIERFSSLRFIQLTSAGFDRVPMDYVRAHHIKIHNASGIYSIPLAECAVFGVLQFYKQSRFFAENQRRHQWEKGRDLLELYGKRVCVIGCGEVGTECARRFHAFGCEVVGINRTIREDFNFERMTPLSQIDGELSEADVVILSIALTKDTYHLLDAQRLALMKSGAVLVNIARGGVVDTDALIMTLPRLRGAALDVFEEEPLNEASPLWDMENVIITPHNAFLGEQNTDRIQKLIIRTLRMYMR